MLPFDVPPGTTLESLFTDVLPRAHALMVREPSRERFVVVQQIRGLGSFTLTIQGPEMKVTEGEAKSRDFWLLVDRRVAQLFLDDWMGQKTLLPASKPGLPPLIAASDPRLLKRLALVSGKAELALTGFSPARSELGGRVAMTAASGAAAKKPIEADDPDVVFEASTDPFTRLLAGTLSPEDAIADGAVTVRGKRLLAMQFAFAFAPFYPKR